LTELFELGGDAEIIEIAVPRQFVNHSLRQIELRSRFQVHAVAVRRLPKDADRLTLVTEVPPNPDRVLKSGERMLVIGGHEALGRFLDEVAAT
jgi:Trk K+ transport system NAD-binding subunit